MSQTRIMTTVETTANTFIGLAVSWAFTLYGLPFLFGVNFTATQAIEITLCYFVLSFCRSFLVRRGFNSFDK